MIPSCPRLLALCTLHPTVLTEYSGGAVFHTGSLWLVHTMFEGNMAGAEGPAMISIGLLQGITNVSFSQNSYFCSAGEYGFISQSQVRIMPKLL